MKTEKQTVTVPGYMGQPWQVDGYVVAGLIVHKMGGSWCISHVATGKRIESGDRLHKDCVARMRRYLDILPDWTADSLDGLAKAYGGDARSLADAIRKASY